MSLSTSFQYLPKHFNGSPWYERRLALGSIGVSVGWQLNILISLRMSNAYMCWLIAMPNEVWATSILKSMWVYLSLLSDFCLFEKMNFETLVTLYTVSCKGGIKEENRVRYFTCSHTKLYQVKTKATKPNMWGLVRPIKKTTKPTNKSRIAKNSKIIL